MPCGQLPSPQPIPELAAPKGSGNWLIPPASTPAQPTTKAATEYFSPAPFFAPGMWYGSVEADILKPHVTDRVEVYPAAPLNWTGAPKLMLGYRCGDGAGDVNLTYRGFGTQGTTVIPNFDQAGAGQEKSRLDVQTVNLEYLSSEIVPGADELSPFFRRQLVVGFGLGVATWFHDSQITGQQILSAHTSTNYWGIGPRAVLRYTQPVGLSSLSLYFRGGAEGLFGQIKNSVSQTTSTGVGNVFQNTGPFNTGAVIVAGEFGVNYTPPSLSSLRLAAGYSLEQWWFLSSSLQNGGSQFLLQGIVLRAEYRY